MSVRDRLYELKFSALMRTFSKYPRPRVARWRPARHHVYIGTADMSRTPAHRQMRTLIRLKANRETL
jgi:hypothetical protein